MVENYWLPYSPAVFGPEPRAHIARAFEVFDAIRTEDEYLAYLTLNPFRMSANPWTQNELTEGAALADYYDMRRALDAATVLKTISNDPELFAEHAPRAGVTVQTKTLAEYAGLGGDDLGLIAHNPKLTLRFEGSEYLRYLIWAASGRAESFEAPIKKLEKILDKTAERRYSLKLNGPKGATLTLSGTKVFLAESEGAEMPPETAADMALSLFDALCNLNLSGIEAREIDGKLQRYTDKGPAALWLSYCEEIDAGRIALCPVCGRPMVISGERGTPREYCSQACRLWRRKHPGETREPKNTLRKR